jgi:hypothetical protein
VRVCAQCACGSRGVWRSFKEGEAFELEKPWVTRDVMLPFFFFYSFFFFFLWILVVSMTFGLHELF